MYPCHTLTPWISFKQKRCLSFVIWGPDKAIRTLLVAYKQGQFYLAVMEARNPDPCESSTHDPRNFSSEIQATAGPKSWNYFSGKIHAPKNNFLAVHEILIGITEHWSHEAEAMAAKKQKDLMESSWSAADSCPELEAELLPVVKNLRSRLTAFWILTSSRHC